MTFTFYHSIYAKYIEYFVTFSKWLENCTIPPIFDRLLDYLLPIHMNESDSDSDSNTEYESDSDSDYKSIISELEYDYVSSNCESDCDCDSDSDSDSESDCESNSRIYPSFIIPTQEDEEDEKDEIQEKPRIVSIEGNIGAGKTTLIRKLQDKYKDREDILFLEEPLSIWETFQSKDGQTILEKFYENPTKYAFMFQILAFQSRYEMIHRAIQTCSKKVRTIVLERSLDADYHIFAKRLVEDGIMEKIAFDIYYYTIRERLAQYGSDGIIWLNVPPEECYHRVQKRGREGEDGITLEYLCSCDDSHLEWLSSDNTVFVLHIDSNDELEPIHPYLF